MKDKKYLIVMLPTAIIVFSLLFILDNEYRRFLYLPIILAWIVYYVWRYKDKKRKPS
ncbi:hypothetical protein [Gottfriedia luciferensis]|uniref:hypothetical protein n=1 Tax=Gottfriedia luciferensis TaxID=178774 RepID=UPI0013023040|nr:hypothetical protein [Gottfriedia luciferensis]